ncbi:MAG TPA: glycoside hydrolase family 15 protein [Candidatus Binataceae bacterium]|jgi:glucoamylase|nr:glycoside hydrolase family 15 protein [Candidatus Binataceae bacterium]
MAIIYNSRPATGGPGIEPRWTRGAKDAIGTSYSVASSIWFTLSAGIVNEIYYPTIDRPQTRDMQFLVTDGTTFFSDERSLVTEIDYIESHALGLKLTNSDPQHGYQIVKEVIADPHQECLLINARLEGKPEVLEKLHLYVLLAPHLEVGGAHNNGNVVETSGRLILTAHKNNTWLALDVSSGFVRRTCGFVGTTDGWRELSENFQLANEFDSATDGNVALLGEINLGLGYEFTLGLAFGDSLHRAITTLFQSLGLPFEEARDRFVLQWTRACTHVLPLDESAGDGGKLYRTSHSLIMAHEDKTYPGALIASLSIPWGEVKGDEDLGGYHLVWTRDMVNSATGLLASGNATLALRALIYLAATQLDDGGFYQNFWINGEPYWKGVQLDEVAFPIALAWRLLDIGELKNFDPMPMVERAAKFLILNGPATGEERWEENAGYSPSTLAIVIAALVCASQMLRRVEGRKGDFLLQYADFLESHLNDWTVTTQGVLVPGIKRHFIRILPVDVSDPQAAEDPEHAVIQIKNRPPRTQSEFPANQVVDAGFLELVRYGIRPPGDPLIEDSLRVVDAALKCSLPEGPCWRRYNHDGYGQQADGSSWHGSGVGRPWPLLTGERGHYELAAGRDVRPYIRAMERFASATGLLPEQVWDEPDKPEKLMFLGKTTGAAMPLMWAHAEYIKLLRSARDGKVFDLIPEVASHFRTGRRGSAIEVWKFNRQVRAVPPGTTLRVLAAKAFMLHWCLGDWSSVSDADSKSTVIGLHYVDIAIAKSQRAPVKFTFRWMDENRWEGRDFEVAMKTN